MQQWLGTNAITFLRHIWRWSCVIYAKRITKVLSFWQSVLVGRWRGVWLALMQSDLSLVFLSNWNCKAVQIFSSNNREKRWLVRTLPDFLLDLITFSIETVIYSCSNCPVTIERSDDWRKRNQIFGFHTSPRGSFLSPKKKLYGVDCGPEWVSLGFFSF